LSCSGDGGRRVPTFARRLLDPYTTLGNGG